MLKEFNFKFLTVCEIEEFLHSNRNGTNGQLQPQVFCWRVWRTNGHATCMSDGIKFNFLFVSDGNSINNGFNWFFFFLLSRCRGSRSYFPLPHDRFMVKCFFYWEKFTSNRLNSIEYETWNGFVSVKLMCPTYAASITEFYVRLRAIDKCLWLIYSVSVHR